MTDAELKEKMEERQMCEEAPGVVLLLFIFIWTIFSCWLHICYQSLGLVYDYLGSSDHYWFNMVIRKAQMFFCLDS